MGTATTISPSRERVLRAFLNDDDLEAMWKVSRSLVDKKVGGVWSIIWDDWGPEVRTEERGSTPNL